MNRMTTDFLPLVGRMQPASPLDNRPSCLMPPRATSIELLMTIVHVAWQGTAGKLNLMDQRWLTCSDFHFF